VRIVESMQITNKIMNEPRAVEFLDWLRKAYLDEYELELHKIQRHMCGEKENEALALWLKNKYKIFTDIPLKKAA